MKIGVIGLGFVGNAIYEVLKKKDLDVKGFDILQSKSKNSFEECLDSDILFLALQTPYNSKTFDYDYSHIENCLKKIEEKNYKGIILNKSTMNPNASVSIQEKFLNLKIIHNPEFLKAISAKEDFENQENIVLGVSKTNINEEDIDIIKTFYKKYFSKAKINIVNSTESECVKIFCNCFYATKIQFFNELYKVCENLNLNYQNVLNCMLNNNRINENDVNVPGPDGKLSYGGYCYPKDTNALNEFMKKNNLPNKVLNSVIKERNEMRNDNANIL